MCVYYIDVIIPGIYGGPDEEEEKVMRDTAIVKDVPVLNERCFFGCCAPVMDSREIVLICV